MTLVGGLILGIVASMLGQYLWELHRRHDLLLACGRALRVVAEWIIEKRGAEKLNRFARVAHVTLSRTAA